jgi:hypothetical protein
MYLRAMATILLSNLIAVAILSVVVPIPVLCFVVSMLSAPLAKFTSFKELFLIYVVYMFANLAINMPAVLGQYTVAISLLSHTPQQVLAYGISSSTLISSFTIGFLGLGPIFIVVEAAFMAATSKAFSRFSLSQRLLGGKINGLRS